MLAYPKIRPALRSTVAGGRALRVTVLAILSTIVAILILLPGCADDDPAMPPRPPDPPDRLLALTTDYATGSLTAIGLEAPWTAERDLEPVCADAVARVHGGLVYVVNRHACDNIQVIDPADWSTLQEFSVGAGTNPQDIAVITRVRAYVSRYESNDLLEVDPSSGVVLGTISLSSFADADGLCEMHRMIVRGDRLFVQVQRMVRQAWPDPWLPSPPSQLVVIDLDTRQIIDADPATPGVQGVPLAGTNPAAPMQIDPATGDLLVPLAGQYGVADAGGVERVDPIDLVSRGFAVTEAALGGDLIDIALWSSTRAYALVSDATYNTVLLAWNPASGEVIGPVYQPGGYVLSDLLVSESGRLFIADRTFLNPGVRVFHAATGDSLGGPVGAGLPPFELLLLPGSAPAAPPA